MLKRTQVRDAVIAVLTDPDTVAYTEGGTGLTLAQGRVFDTHLDVLALADCGSEKSARDLPAIAVYTEDETLGVSDPGKYDDLCFDRSSLSLVLELYVCAKTGYELERVLDELEEQVRFKLLPDRRFYGLVKLRGYRSYPKRSKEGRRLGLRALHLELEYSQSVDAACHSPGVPLRSRLEFETPVYKKPGDDPALRTV